MEAVKKIVSYILIGMVVLFTVIALLGIWDVISLERIGWKMITSLIIIFASSAVILFIFAVLIKDNNNQQP
jgi:hypothetical protein